MKKDKLETWFENNREEFEDKSPSKNLWRNIQFKMGWNNRNNSELSNFMWKAAAILFFGISCYLYGAHQYEPISQSQKEEFKNVEAYYLNEIKNKTNLIIKLSGTEALPNPATDLDLRRMDAMYQVLKDEYQQNPSQKIREAMMLNLLIRTDILNDEIIQVENPTTQSM